MLCGKICLTKRESELVLSQKKKKGRQHSKEIRNYYCELCNAWHTTSMETPVVEVKEVPLKYSKKWKKIVYESRKSS